MWIVGLHSGPGRQEIHSDKDVSLEIKYLSNLPIVQLLMIPLLPIVWLWLL